MKNQAVLSVNPATPPYLQKQVFGFYVHLRVGKPSPGGRWHGKAVPDEGITFLFALISHLR